MSSRNRIYHILAYDHGQMLMVCFVRCCVLLISSSRIRVYRREPFRTTVRPYGRSARSILIDESGLAFLQWTRRSGGLSLSGAVCRRLQAYDYGMDKGRVKELQIEAETLPKILAAIW